MDVSFQDFMDSVERVSIFGQPNSQDFLSVELEKKEQERQMKIQRKKKEQAIKKQKELEEKNRQELEDYQFALQEQERINAQRSPRKYNSAKGRGQKIEQQIKENSLMKGRGFPCTSNHDESHAPSSIFWRAKNIKNQINQCNGGENYHNNNFQRQFWHGEWLEPRSSSSSSYSSAKFEDACNTSESSPSPRSFQSASSTSTSPLPSTHFPEESFLVPAVDGLVLEPAGKATVEPAVQPVVEQFPALPSPRKHTRKPRLAANFTNKIEDQITNKKSFSAVTTSENSSRANNAKLCDKDTSSQSRIPELLDPEFFMKKNGYSSNQNGFALNKNEFPAL